MQYLVFRTYFYYGINSLFSSCFIEDHVLMSKHARPPHALIFAIWLIALHTALWLGGVLKRWCVAKTRSKNCNPVTLDLAEPST